MREALVVLSHQYLDTTFVNWNNIIDSSFIYKFLQCALHYSHLKQTIKNQLFLWFSSTVICSILLIHIKIVFRTIKWWRNGLEDSNFVEAILNEDGWIATNNVVWQVVWQHDVTKFIGFMTSLTHLSAIDDNWLCLDRSLLVRLFCKN